jgi:hypothetical protein
MLQRVRVLTAVPSAGCLESIIHYKRLLLRNWSHELDAPQLSYECIDLLKRLEALDPMRRNRYQELGESLFEIIDTPFTHVT